MTPVLYRELAAWVLPEGRSPPDSWTDAGNYFARGTGAARRIRSAHRYGHERLSGLRFEPGRSGTKLFGVGSADG